MKLHFRHVPRERNKIADWAGRVAHVCGRHVDLTHHCFMTSAFGEPPWKAGEAGKMLGEGE